MTKNIPIPQQLINIKKEIYYLGQTKEHRKRRNCDTQTDIQASKKRNTEAEARKYVLQGKSPSAKEREKQPKPKIRIHETNLRKFSSGKKS